MTRVLIIGAGAVGRGFLAPLVARAGAAVDFADTDKQLVARLAAHGGYETAVTRDGGYDMTRVAVADARDPGAVEDIAGYDAVFVSVGVGSLDACAPLVSKARVVCVLENIRDAALRLSALAGNANMCFGIPDVIVSNTASPELLTRDPLCLVAEPGDLILEGPPRAGLNFLRGAVWADGGDFEAHWACKFYIHNASHAVAAFLGARAGHRFVGEAMADPRVGAVVDGAIEAITEALIDGGTVPRDQAMAYMERELRRFRNPLMFDPIDRVARDPLRKLAPGDRLMRALALVREAARDARPLMAGINAALEAVPGNFEADSEAVLREHCGLADDLLIRDILTAADR